MTEQPNEPQAHGVRIHAEPGQAAISIDGTALPAGMVTGYMLEHQIAGVLPLLTLYTRQPSAAVFDGLARVAVGVPKAPGEIVAEFLAQIDPVLLDQQALNRADYSGGEGATARAMLATLTDWARGVGA